MAVLVAVQSLTSLLLEAVAEQTRAEVQLAAREESLAAHPLGAAQAMLVMEEGEEEEEMLLGQVLLILVLQMDMPHHLLL